MRRRGIATGLKVSLLKYKTPMEFPVVHVSLFYKYFAPLEQVSLLNHKSRRDLLFVVVVFNSTGKLRRSLIYTPNGLN